VFDIFHRPLQHKIKLSISHRAGFRTSYHICSEPTLINISTFSSVPGGRRSKDASPALDVSTRSDTIRRYSPKLCEVMPSLQQHWKKLLEVTLLRLTEDRSRLPRLRFDYNEERLRFVNRKSVRLAASVSISMFYFRYRRSIVSPTRRRERSRVPRVVTSYIDMP
jgi:hypothetical protein